MKQVYAPANTAEAHMLAHLLEQAGVRAHVHGEALQGAVGESPAANLLQLLVADEDYDIVYYDEIGEPTEQKSDEDLDGVLESLWTFGNSLLHRSDIDTDGSGEPDVAITSCPHRASA
jgi:hypothetical protein